MGGPVEVLAAACGGAVVSAAGDADRVLGIRPRAVARPGSAAELAEVLGACAGRGWPVLARGGGTKLDWGAAPEALDVVVDTGRLDRVLEHAAGDLVVRVEAGVRIGALQDRLRAAGQRLALDSPYPQASIGGLIATASSGPSRLLYGGPRDLLIGVTVALADGTLARSGGKVVKNVAGYDLGKLYAGSFGTLGIVTEAVFRLHPQPAAQEYLAVDLPDAGLVGPAVRRLRGAALVPTAVEIRRVAPGWLLVVLLEGGAPGVAERARRCRDLLGGRSVPRPPWWGLLPEPAGGTLLKLVAEPAAVAEVLRSADAVLAEIDPDYRLQGSAGVDVVYAGLSAAADAARVRDGVHRLRRALAGWDGSAVVLRAPEAVRDGLDVWGPAAGLALMRRVKQEFDPQRRLAPGRFVGGI